MPDKPISPPQADFPQLHWRSLQNLPSQLPVGDYSQYEFAFSRGRHDGDNARLWVHAICDRDSYLRVVTMGFQVSAEPVGFATVAGGEIGFYFDPDRLARTKHYGESLAISITSYHLFSKAGLPLQDRIWFVGIDALRGYFGRGSRQARQGQQQHARDWCWDRNGTRDRWGTPFQKELCLLGLDRMPTTLAELKLAWKEKLRVCHPDVGGDTAKAQAISAAFETLRSHLGLRN